MKKILVIEDEKVLLDLLQKKFSQEGYDVFGALDGEEGMVKIKEIKPDLILLDILMPKKDGFEVLEEVRQDKDLCGIPIIVISNLGQAEEVDKAIKMGAKDYLVKAEFDPEKVIEKVMQILGDEKKLDDQEKK